MDMGDMWLLDLLKDTLPPSSVEFLHTYALHPHSPLQIFKRNLFVLLNRAFNIVYPFLLPVFSRITMFLHTSPDIVFFLTVLTLLYTVWTVLGVVRRLMLFWVRILTMVLGWGMLVLVGAVMWQRGMEQSIRDIVTVVSKIVGYAEVVREVWVREYERYQEQERRGR